jgi:hypothetical protein
MSCQETTTGGKRMRLCFDAQHMKVRGWSCGAFVARRNSISPLLTFQKRGLPEVIIVSA